MRGGGPGGSNPRATVAPRPPRSRPDRERAGRPRTPGDLLRLIGDRLGRAYLCHGFTKGTAQEVRFLLELTSVTGEDGHQAEVDLWTYVYTPRELTRLSIGVGLVPSAIWSVEPGDYARRPRRSIIRSSSWWP